MNERKYRLEQCQRALELSRMSELPKGWDRDVWNLEYLLTSISPHSRYWRLGIMRSIKRAIQAIKKENKLSEPDAGGLKENEAVSCHNTQKGKTI